MLDLVAILPTPEENKTFDTNPNCHGVLLATMEYYKTIGFNPPWIGYFAKLNGQLVGSAGYKGKPVDNKIEIAYGTFLEFSNQGIGNQICRQLVHIAIMTDPGLIITARTLPYNNYSNRILEKNNFRLLGTVFDKDDGDVWEWLYDRPRIQQPIQREATEHVPKPKT